MFKNIKETIENLVNSKIVEEWVSLFEQKVEREELRNSEYMSSYNKDKPVNYLFVEEDEKLNEIEKAEKKIKIKLEKIEKIEAKLEKKLINKNSKKSIENLEKEIVRLNKKIACLRLFIDDKKEEVKDLELERCKILVEKSKNEKKKGLSKEDRAIRDIENKIWKIVLDNYFLDSDFQDKIVKILKLKEYEKYVDNFKRTIKELTIDNKKCYDALLDIVTTLYEDVSRDKLFLERENIKTDRWENINLDEHSINLQSLSLKNQCKQSL